MKKMLNLSVCALLFAGSLFINSCSKTPLIIPYSIGEKEYCLNANVNQAYVNNTFNITHADVAAVMSAAGITDLGRVTKAVLKAGFKVKVSGSGFTTLDQIGNVELYMKETGTGGDGTQVAYSDAIGAGATEVLLLVNGVDIKLVTTKDVTFTVKVLNKAGGNSAGCVKLTDGIIEVSVKK